jgi:hypothetical protein
MSGLKKTRRDGREERIALDDEMFRVMPEDEPSGAADGGASELDDDLDMTLEEDDLMPEPRRRSGRGRAVWLTLLVLIIVAVSGLAAWMALTPGSTVLPGTDDDGEVVAAVTQQPASTAVPSLPTVRAEEEPFKFRPDDPGGLRVENTDRRVYEQVGEGARVDGADDVEQLLPAPSPPVAPPVPEPAPDPAPETVAAEEPATPAPETPEETAPPTAAEVRSEPEPAGEDATATAAPDAAPEPETEPEPEPDVTTPAAPAENVAIAVENGPLIQLAAFKERALAERQWETLRDAHGDLLGRVAPVIVYADLGDLGQFYRLRAGPLADVGAAEALCRDLRRRDVECLVVRD